MLSGKGPSPRLFCATLVSLQFKTEVGKHNIVQLWEGRCMAMRIMLMPSIQHRGK